VTEKAVATIILALSAWAITMGAAEVAELRSHRGLKSASRKKTTYRHD
jgi:hypothetical protein